MLTMECLNGDIFAKLDKNDAAPWFDVLNYHVLLFDVSMPLISRIKIIGAPLRLIGHILNDWSRDKRKITVSWKKSNPNDHILLCIFVKCLKHMLWMEGLYKRKEKKRVNMTFSVSLWNLTFKYIYLFIGLGGGAWAGRGAVQGERKKQASLGRYSETGLNVRTLWT